MYARTRAAETGGGSSATDVSTELTALRADITALRTLLNDSRQKRRT